LVTMIQRRLIQYYVNKEFQPKQSRKRIWSRLYRPVNIAW
jgi:hypothetical protein